MVNKELKDMKNKQLNNIVTEMKNALEGIKRRINEAEEWIMSWRIEWWK